MRELLQNNNLVLTEAAIIERLRRSSDVCLHETLVNAPLIYDPVAGMTMATIYREYLELATEAQLPMLICTPTWRANHERVYKSGISSNINQDAAAFMRRIKNELAFTNSVIRIGGLIGCKNDCYLPEEGLGAMESQDFHAWQIGELVEGGVDFLIAETLPCVQEALGIAKAMEATPLPYIISFVISRDGYVLDGSPLDTAIRMIDGETQRPPLGYTISCAHPSFLCPQSQPSGLFKRLIGYQANACALDHCDLDSADTLVVDDVVEWGRLMLELNQNHGVTILGGCCGTDIRHLDYLVRYRKRQLHGQK